MASPYASLARAYWFFLHNCSLVDSIPILLASLRKAAKLIPLTGPQLTSHLVGATLTAISAFGSVKGRTIPTYGNHNSITGRCVFRLPCHRRVRRDSARSFSGPFVIAGRPFRWYGLPSRSGRSAQEGNTLPRLHVADFALFIAIWIMGAYPETLSSSSGRSGASRDTAITAEATRFADKCPLRFRAVQQRPATINTTRANRIRSVDVGEN